MRFIWKKILRLILVVLAVSALTFLMVNILPGDVADILGWEYDEDDGPTVAQVARASELHFEMGYVMRDVLAVWAEIQGSAL